jgi:hypothetical protein
MVLLIFSAKTSLENNEERKGNIGRGKKQCIKVNINQILP